MSKNLNLRSCSTKVPQERQSNQEKELAETTKQVKKL